MEIPERFPAPGMLVDLGEVTLWADDQGDGEPLVLLGGFSAGHYIWDFVRPHLTGFRTITLEPRGLGRSDRPPPPYSEQVWADDLRALLDRLGVERTHVWATGFGNYYGIRFVADHPERVGRFVAYTDVWAGDEAKRYAAIWNVYRAIVESFGTTGFGARLLSKIFDVPWLPWFTVWEEENIAQVLHPETVAATVGYCLTQADVRGDLERISAPTLVLQGDHGWDGQPLRAEDDESLALMRERIADLRVVTIPESHPGYVIAHKPQECARAVRAFLAA
ncbi:MAG TPA: alpha/beta hydrolase [Gaiellaceae bacterium]|jgi:pimeloyl-ACP methyl ester carboxylesterase|nr:alpha/beta hydrolase [Gaiellaceae bacterium]